MLDMDLSVLPGLETDRLQLRAFQESDADALHLLRADQRTMLHIGRPRSTGPANALALIRSMEEERQRNAGIGWAIHLREEDRLIGTVGYYRLKKEHHTGEVGYLLDPEHWGNGLMHEALGAVLACGFDRFRFHRVEAITDPRNTASRMVLERRGFRLEGLFKENFLWEGRFLDSAVYSLLNPRRAS